MSDIDFYEEFLRKVSESHRKKNVDEFIKGINKQVISELERRLEQTKAKARMLIDIAYNRAIDDAISSINPTEKQREILEKSKRAVRKINE